MASGKVVPVVQRRFPFEQAADAIELVGSGGGNGTPVVAV
jgi:hypothetical protein